VGDHYRFHRSELVEWATEHGIGIAAEAVPMSQRFDAAMPRLSDALRAGGIHHGVEASDRASALAAIVARIPLEDEADRELLMDVLLAREALGSTGVGDGIAIPHVRTPLVLHTAQASVTLCFLAQPIDFDAIDGKPVHTFFTLVTPTIRAHLHLLSRLSAALSDPELHRAVTERASAEEIIARAEAVDQKLDLAAKGGA
jgi:PTS system nitrogen regulatory IIA component